MIVIVIVIITIIAKGKQKGKNLNLNSCKGKGRDRVKGALSSISSSSSSSGSSSCSWRVPSTCHIHQVPDQTSPYKSILNPLINCDVIDIKSQDASMPPYRHASSYYRIIVRETDIRGQTMPMTAEKDRE